MDAPLELLAVLGLLRLHHGGDTLRIGLSAAVAARAARLALGTVAPAAFASRAGFTRQALVLRHRVVLEHLAFEDPGLHADDAVGGLGFREAIVDVGAQRVTRHPALVVRLGAGDLGAAETPGHLDAHALRPKPRGALHRALHGP